MGEGQNMIEALREEGIVHKVGGRFKLSTLIQKRLVAINSGARPLVDIKTENKIEVVIQEILQDKIYLDTELNVQIAAAQQPAAEELDFRNL
jgi:DNA-directed RNA polymerase subunit omega